MHRLSFVLSVALVGSAMTGALAQTTSVATSKEGLRPGQPVQVIRPAVRYGAPDPAVEEFRALSQRIDRTDGERAELKAKKDALDTEIARLESDLRQALFEYRAGQYCSECKRTKTEIERAGEVFSTHLSRVKGEARTPSFDDVRKKEDELRRPIAAKVRERDDVSTRLRNVNAELERSVPELPKLVLRSINSLGERTKALGQELESAEKAFRSRADLIAQSHRDLETRLRQEKARERRDPVLIQNLMVEQKLWRNEFVALYGARQETLLNFGLAGAELEQVKAEVFRDMRYAYNTLAERVRLPFMANFIAPSLNLSVGGLSLRSNVGLIQSQLAASIGSGAYKVKVEIASDNFLQQMQVNTSAEFFRGLEVGVKRTTSFDSGEISSRPYVTFGSGLKRLL